MNIKSLFITATIIFFAFHSNAQASPDSTNFIYEKVDVEAKFPGDEKEWRNFLRKNLNAATPADNRAPEGS